MTNTYVQQHTSWAYYKVYKCIYVKSKGAGEEVGMLIFAYYMTVKEGGGRGLENVLKLHTLPEAERNTLINTLIKMYTLFIFYMGCRNLVPKSDIS